MVCRFFFFFLVDKINRLWSRDILTTAAHKMKSNWYDTHRLFNDNGFMFLFYYFNFRPTSTWVHFIWNRKIYYFKYNFFSDYIFSDIFAGFLLSFSLFFFYPHFVLFYFSVGFDFFLIFFFAATFGFDFLTNKNIEPKRCGVIDVCTCV